MILSALYFALGTPTINVSNTNSFAICQFNLISSSGVVTQVNQRIEPGASFDTGVPKAGDTFMATNAIACK